MGISRTPIKSYFDCETRHYCLPNSEDETSLSNNVTRFDEFGNVIFLDQCPGYLEGRDEPGHLTEPPVTFSEFTGLSQDRIIIFEKKIEQKKEF